MTGRRRMAAACLAAFLAGTTAVPVRAAHAGGEVPDRPARLTLLLGAKRQEAGPGTRPWLRETSAPGESASGGSPVRVIAATAALVAGVGLAIFLKREADDRYDRYLATADPDAARDLFDAAERYDRASLLGWGMAQAGFILLFYSLIKEAERPLIPVSGEASFRSDGVRIGLRMTP